ncbi:MAG: hypothetical protein H6644_17575 [Caldilineaceae bacterium]|nr:hypothetical protein [Caldilineaceae bacterium]
MKRTLSLVILLIFAGAIYVLYPLLVRDPEVLAIGFTVGMIFGGVTGIPTALLVMAAQRRRDEPAPASAPRPAQPALPYPMAAAYPPNFVMPYGMADTNGSWQTNGVHDMSWGPPPTQ